MNSKDEIADILRDNIYYSPQVQGVVVRGAIEKLETREEKAYCRGLRDALWVILAIVLAIFVISAVRTIVNRPPAFTIPTPEQQMEDTLVARGWPRDKMKFSHPIQEDSL